MPLFLLMAAWPVASHPALAGAAPLRAHGGEYRDPGEPVPPSMAVGPVTATPAPPLPPGARLLETVRDLRLPGHERAAALEELAFSTGPLPYEVLRSVRNHLRTDQLPLYAGCLARCGPAALEELRDLAGHRDPLTRAEAVYAVASLDREKGAAFALQVLQQADSPVEARVAALRGLADGGALQARVAALRLLSTATGPLFLEALAVLRREPEDQDAPYLIRALEEREDRWAAEALRELQRRTGYRMGRDPRPWRFQYLRHKAAETAFEVSAPIREPETATASFAGIPILGEKVVFLVDLSGSMTGTLATAEGQTRIQRALLELEATLKALPPTAAFQVLAFAASVEGFKGEGRWLSAGRPEPAEILAWLQGRLAEGATDLHGALEQAFRREGVEEIFLLSDGVPNAGSVWDLDRLREEVAQWNRWRRVRLNVVALGAPLAARAFLQSLAEAHDGAFRVVN